MIDPALKKVTPADRSNSQMQGATSQLSF